MRPKLYTTGQAAKRVGVSRQTVHAWIDAGKVDAPPAVGGVRLWNEQDVAKLSRVERRKYPTKKAKRPK
jgi:excisionase family DNA binding protein